jgi:hypothetical protein
MHFNPPKKRGRRAKDEKLRREGAKSCPTTAELKANWMCEIGEEIQETSRRNEDEDEGYDDGCPPLTEADVSGSGLSVPSYSYDAGLETGMHVNYAFLRDTPSLILDSEVLPAPASKLWADSGLSAGAHGQPQLVPKPPDPVQEIMARLYANAPRLASKPLMQIPTTESSCDAISPRLPLQGGPPQQFHSGFLPVNESQPRPGGLLSVGSEPKQQEGQSLGEDVQSSASPWEDPYQNFFTPDPLPALSTTALTEDTSEGPLINFRTNRYAKK